MSAASSSYEWLRACDGRHCRSYPGIALGYVDPFITCRHHFPKVLHGPKLVHGKNGNTTIAPLDEVLNRQRQWLGIRDHEMKEWQGWCNQFQ